MQRREFLKKSSLMGGLIILNPKFNYSIFNEFSEDELIGKGKPILLGDDFKLRNEAFLQFNMMRIAAKESGFNIHVISSYRSYTHQNGIWERKYKNYRNQGLSHEKTIAKIIEYSTIPGTSRHHWGTDLDIIDATKGIPSNPLSEVHFNEGGRMRKFKLWLDQNTENFGFYLVYTNDPNRKGFAYEPWHFTYKPIATRMLKEYKELDIKKILQGNKLMGSENFTDEFVEKYKRENILDINPALLV
ncbi:M15 family metallopeptidase [Moheibacter lacus]|uniref:M15 family metallopeptidase n=1 Tax=Moheibacter lacus TaxID=2745851 RepID=A0A838ZJ71_9FLAO|nr:M15 family metallopeptidase [Moheibacter lacus]MBA5629691.1 M15 family metallopeptidase [Moheibacter lacus]